MRSLGGVRERRGGLAADDRGGLVNQFVVVESLHHEKGEVDAAREHVTMVINIPTLSSTGTATFTAANGDTLLATVAGQATRTSPTTLSIVEAYTVTGGTGRFADATGSFTLESTLDQTTGGSTGAFSGTLEH